MDNLPNGSADRLERCDGLKGDPKAPEDNGDGLHDMGRLGDGVEQGRAGQPTALQASAHLWSSRSSGASGRSSKNPSTAVRLRRR
jgi:hypothetical protein